METVESADQRMRAVMKQSLELSKSGEHTSAVEVLDEALADAVRNHRSRWIRLISRHAAVICRMTGDLAHARHYYETLLTDSPDDRFGLYGLADVICEEGDAERAKWWAAKSYAACLQGDDDMSRRLIELLLFRWPTLGNAGRE
jgi:hypothetical protein